MPSWLNFKGLKNLKGSELVQAESDSNFGDLRKDFRIILLLLTLARYINGSDSTMVEDYQYTYEATEGAPEGALHAAAHLLVRDHETVATVFQRNKDGIVAVSEKDSQPDDDDVSKGFMGSQVINNIAGLVGLQNARSDNKSKNSVDGAEVLEKGSSHWDKIKEHAWNGLKLKS
jgi:hypothetical protein